MKKEFKTVKQVQAHLINVKKRMDRIKAKNPDLTFSTYNIRDISIELIYKIQDFIKENKSYYSSSEKIEYKNDILSIWAWSCFAVTVYFTTKKVVKDCDCVERKEFKEAPIEVKQSV